MFMGHLTRWVRFKVPGPFGPRDNSKFETLLAKVFSPETKNKIKYFQLLLKKSNFYFPSKQSKFPLDKELQWVNVKQKPFRQI